MSFEAVMLLTKTAINHQFFRIWSEVSVCVCVCLCVCVCVCVGGGGVTCICHDMGMCHYFGYFFGLFPDFWVSFFGKI